MAKSSDFNPGGFKGEDDPHRLSDVDSAWFSQHHTLGPKANQASPGNHDHDGITSKVVKARWTDYTPVWSGNTGTQPSLGNGVITGKYSKLGFLTFFKIKLIMGSTSTYGTSSIWYFTLPDTGQGDFYVFGNALCYDNDIGSLYYYFVRNISISAGSPDDRVLVAKDGGSYVKNTVPMTWAVNDVLTLNGYYESVNP